MGINIGRLRLGFREGPAFPQEMDFLVLPDHPASGQLRVHIIQQESVFHRAFMVVVGPIVYFVLPITSQRCIWPTFQAAAFAMMQI
jgi:hypothetical protein